MWWWWNEQFEIWKLCFCSEDCPGQEWRFWFVGGMLSKSCGTHTRMLATYALGSWLRCRQELDWRRWIFGQRPGQAVIGLACWQQRGLSLCRTWEPRFGHNSYASQWRPSDCCGFCRRDHAVLWGQKHSISVGHFQYNGLQEQFARCIQHAHIVSRLRQDRRHHLHSQWFHVRGEDNFWLVHRSQDQHNHSKQKRFKF